LSLLCFLTAVILFYKLDIGTAVADLRGYSARRETEKRRVKKRRTKRQRIKNQRSRRWGTKRRRSEKRSIGKRGGAKTRRSGPRRKESFFVPEREIMLTHTPRRRMETGEEKEEEKGSL
jgi:hypothetical protein